jgi:hypothetical protein
MIELIELKDCRTRPGRIRKSPERSADSLVCLLVTLRREIRGHGCPRSVLESHRLREELTKERRVFRVAKSAVKSPNPVRDGLSIEQTRPVLFSFRFSAARVGCSKQVQSVFSAPLKNKNKSDVWQSAIYRQAIPNGIWGKRLLQ